MCTVCRLYAVYLFVFCNAVSLYVYPDVRRVISPMIFTCLSYVFLRCRTADIYRMSLKVTSKINQQGGYNITR